jgi:hypothetical protein
VSGPARAVPPARARAPPARGPGRARHARALLADGDRYRISQGVELGRASVLTGRIDAGPGGVDRVHVAGAVHAVARGRIRRPNGSNR